MENKENIEESAVKLFENTQGQEQWYAFLKLVTLKEEIEKKWYTTLIDELKAIKLGSLWKFIVPKVGTGIIVWYLDGFKAEDSLSIWLEREHFSLKIKDDKTQKQKIKDEIDNIPEYKVLFDQFQYNNEASDVIFRETGFLFESRGEEINNGEELAWFAGNETKEFVKEVEKKLEAFFEAKLTDALIQLNQKFCAKK